MSPTAMPCAASITALSPDPQTLLIVSAATSSSETAAQCRLPGRRLAEAGRDDVAHDAFVDDGGVDAGAGDGFADDDGAELRGGELLQRPEELAGRGSNGGNDDGVHNSDLRPHREPESPEPKV